MLFRSFAPEVGDGPLTDSSMVSWNVQLATRFRTSSVNLVMLAVYYGRDFLYAHTSVRGAETWKKRFLSFKYFLSCNRDDWWLFRNRVVSFLDRERSSFFLIATRRWTEVITNVAKYINLFSFLVFLLSLLSYFEKIAHMSVLCAYVSLWLCIFVCSDVSCKSQ